jgi:8-oxo-dGTP pyrophosphatase MutT (NUDIX family)
MKQDESLAMTAIRETFEESGLLLASHKSSKSSSPLDNSVLDEARDAIHAQKMLFQSFLTDHDLQADVSSLLPFTEWITPVNALRYVPAFQITCN